AKCSSRNIEDPEELVAVCTQSCSRYASLLLLMCRICVGPGRPWDLLNRAINFGRILLRAHNERRHGRMMDSIPNPKWRLSCSNNTFSDQRPSIESVRIG